MICADQEHAAVIRSSWNFSSLVDHVWDHVMGSVVCYLAVDSG